MIDTCIPSINIQIMNLQVQTDMYYDLRQKHQLEQRNLLTIRSDVINLWLEIDEMKLHGGGIAI
ncbi:hypothetical protein Syun_018971 [Stephania yunnanensis]|uniref:Uncharacterized protein n=1 Tax=Stephania yunnanensis TaxID=152371 RepID=A0AAP0ITD1_9MAGN